MFSLIIYPLLQSSTPKPIHQVPFPKAHAYIFKTQAMSLFPFLQGSRMGGFSPLSLLPFPSFPSIPLFLPPRLLSILLLSLSSFSFIWPLYPSEWDSINWPSADSAIVLLKILVLSSGNKLKLNGRKCIQALRIQVDPKGWEQDGKTTGSSLCVCSLILFVPLFHPSLFLSKSGTFYLS